MFFKREPNLPLFNPFYSFGQSLGMFIHSVRRVLPLNPVQMDSIHSTAWKTFLVITNVPSDIDRVNGKCFPFKNNCYCTPIRNNRKKKLELWILCFALGLWIRDSLLFIKRSEKYLISVGVSNIIVISLE